MAAKSLPYTWFWDDALSTTRPPHWYSHIMRGYLAIREIVMPVPGTLMMAMRSPMVSSAREEKWRPGSRAGPPAKKYWRPSAYCVSVSENRESYGEAAKWASRDSSGDAGESSCRAELGFDDITGDDINWWLSPRLDSGLPCQHKER